MRNCHDVDAMLVGNVEDCEQDICNIILSLNEDSHLRLYINSVGGEVYSALSIAELMRLRDVRATAYVLGECHSAALIPFAACQTRFVSPSSSFLFHDMTVGADAVSAKHIQRWSTHMHWINRQFLDTLSDMFCIPREQIDKWAGHERYLKSKDLVGAGIAALF